MDNFTSQLEELGDGKAILHLKGEMDLAVRADLTERLEGLARAGLEVVVIDGTEITFMDSTGFHALVDGKRLLHEHGIRIILVASTQMRRVFDLIAPEPIFAARVDTMEDATALLDGATEPLDASDRAQRTPS